MSRRTEPLPRTPRSVVSITIEEVTGKETGLPLIKCPECERERVIEVRAKTGKNMGRVFFKCPRNIPGMLGRCMFSECQKGYLEGMRELKHVVIDSEAWAMEEEPGEETGLPLIHCPTCNKERVIELRAATVESMGCVFFKCPRNEPDTPFRCMFSEWQKAYMKRLQELKYVVIDLKPRLRMPWEVHEETGKETGLPLIKCPICNMEGVRVIEVRVKTGKDMGRVFFKCQRNIPGLLGRCMFSECQKDYLKKLRESKYVVIDSEAWAMEEEPGEETGLPLIQCPTCNMERVIELRAKTVENMGRVFFKCPRNIPGMLFRCMFSEWQKAYMNKLHELKYVVVDPKPLLHPLWTIEEETGKETGLPLIQCPTCNMERVIELRAETVENMGHVFFKCPRNIPGVIGRCMFSVWQEAYLKKLRELKYVVIDLEAGL